jgi:hypothetical protein
MEEMMQTQRIITFAPDERNVAAIGLETLSSPAL